MPSSVSFNLVDCVIRHVQGEAEACAARINLLGSKVPYDAGSSPDSSTGTAVAPSADARVASLLRTLLTCGGDGDVGQLDDGITVYSSDVLAQAARHIAVGTGAS